MLIVVILSLVRKRFLSVVSASELLVRTILSGHAHGHFSICRIEPLRFDDRHIGGVIFGTS
jgi:hypothetical protein